MNQILLRRRVASKGLPYDAEIEYLESTGTQYIDTGIFPTSQSKIECDALWYMVDASNATLFGSRINSPLTMFEVLGNSPKFLYYQYGGASPGKNIAFGIRKVFTANKNILSIDGVAGITAAIATFSIPYSIALFALNKGGITERFCKAMVYRFKAWDADGILVRDFIPVRVGTTGYLYDKISGQLFGNAGTGDFILGPDV